MKRINLTSGMLRVLEDLFNEADAGGFEVHMRALGNDFEREEWLSNADRVCVWLAQEIGKRS